MKSTVVRSDMVVRANDQLRKADRIVSNTSTAVRPIASTLSITSWKKVCEAIPIS